MKVKNIKEEVTHYVENLREKNQTDTQTHWRATPAD
jgi:hypothetical protein